MVENATLKNYSANDLTSFQITSKVTQVSNTPCKVYLQEINGVECLTFFQKSKKLFQVKNGISLFSTHISKALQSSPTLPKP